MKGLVILSVLFFAGAALAIPVDVADYKHRWSLIPDGDGKMHLMDLNPIETEPEPMFNPDNDVFFMLFTRNNPTSGQRFPASFASPSQWVNSRGLRVVIHGWNNNHNSHVNVAITRGLLARADHNVVRVDWGVGANNPNYITSRNHVPRVADVVARFLNSLVARGATAWGRTHIIGHSLGAHIAGLTGKRTSGRVQHIHGLDPAGPLFDMGNAAARLAPGDAIQTDMIATNAGVLGFDQPIAHATFYPSGGRVMPGCGTDIGGACSHGRVVDYYEESINRPQFHSRRCANFGAVTNSGCPSQGAGPQMGGDVFRAASGVFWLSVNGNAPWGRGTAGA